MAGGWRMNNLQPYFNALDTVLCEWDSGCPTLIQNETVLFKKSKIKFWKKHYCSCLFCFSISRPPFSTIFSEKGQIFTSICFETLKVCNFTKIRVFH